MNEGRNKDLLRGSYSATQRMKEEFKDIWEDTGIKWPLLELGENNIHDSTRLLD